MSVSYFHDSSVPAAGREIISSLIGMQSCMGRHHLISHKACQHKNNFSEILEHVWTGIVETLLDQHFAPEGCSIFNPAFKALNSDLLGFIASSNQCLRSPTFSSAVSWQHYVPNLLTTLLGGKTSIYTSGQWLICGTCGWGSASEIEWPDLGGTEVGSYITSLIHRLFFSTYEQRLKETN